ncbi:transcriptional regulator [Adhaeribacter arboris]|uniref:Transcriptional regulator n=1 Tax=Adhaeribacter arboris TaxID=2072846 RepID=A0A2T2YAW1_9BACT|nr:pentapeptide repeat-containing protein [Adhaeribacter arboris]PSR52578.1 transcriptional regulator [Adhaeribacter arboris]
MLNSKSIGNKIAQARKKINFSQADLAQQVAISSQAVGKWERGESMPDITTLNRLAEIFGVDLNYFSDSVKTMVPLPAEAKPTDSQMDEITPLKQRKRFGWNWDMSKGNWVDADFSGLKNLQEKFSASNLKNCKFLNSELAGLILKGNYIENCDFSGSDMRDSKLQASYLFENTFIGCSFIDAEFTKNEINNCSFATANFSGTEFLRVDFQKNTIINAVWKFTLFKDSSLVDITFDGTLEDCSFDNCSFSKVTFKNATLLNTFFKCKTLKHLTFIDCQADRMTYEFLKNGKAVLTGISLLP